MAAVPIEMIGASFAGRAVEEAHGEHGRSYTAGLGWRWTAGMEGDALQVMG